MWKDSIDTLLYKVAYKKEGWANIFVKAGAKEIAQAGAKELVQVGAKELGQALTKEGAQSLLKEGTQTFSKEIGQKLLSEGSQSTLKEGSQVLTKEFSSAAAKELSQQVSKQTLQSGALTAAKKVAAGGLALGTFLALDNIQTTDTNEDGIIDEKDKSLFDKGVGKAAELTGNVLGGVAGTAGDIVSNVFEGLGIDIKVVKVYALKIFYFILFIIALKVLSFLYPLRKIIGLGENNKKFNLYHSIIKKV